MLPIKKIYVDTRLKAPDSRSDSDFFIDLPTTFLMPDDCGFYIEEVCIPHSWYTVEEGINDQLSFTMGPSNEDVTVPPGVYSVTALGAAIATGMSNKAISAGLVPGAGPHFTHEYNNLKQTITIQLTNSLHSFTILTDAELKVDGNTAVLARSINGLIKNYTSKPVNNSPFVSGYIDLNPMRNVYLNCSGLGNFNTVTLTGNRNVVKKIPVNAGPGDVIFDQNVTGMDYLDCSGQTLSRISFRLTDAYNRIVNLHGNHFSFSIVFSRVQDGK